MISTHLKKSLFSLKWLLCALIFITGCQPRVQKTPPPSLQKKEVEKSTPRPSTPLKQIAPKKKIDTDHIPKKKALRYKILLDPGHGGDDFGTHDLKKKYHEKELTLKTALLVKKELEKKGVVIEMTRWRDRALSLKDRVRLSQRSIPTAFVSIHYNSAPNRQAAGMEIFYPLGTQPRAYFSYLLAENILECVGKKGWIIRSSKSANFYVLRNTQIPAVLIEVDFMTNQKQMDLLLQKSSQELLSKSIAEGIYKWLIN